MHKNNNFISNVWNKQLQIMQNRPMWITYLFFVILGFVYPSVFTEMLIISYEELLEPYETWVYLSLWVTITLLEVLVLYGVGKLMKGIAKKEEILLVRIVTSIPIAIVFMIADFLTLHSELFFIILSIWSVYFGIKLLQKAQNFSLSFAIISHLAMLTIDIVAYTILNITLLLL